MKTTSWSKHLKQQLIQWLKIAAFFGVGFLILYLVYQNQQSAYLADCALKGVAEGDCSLIDKVISDFKGSKYQFVVLSIILFTISNIVRALRWQLLLQPLGYQTNLVNTFGATVIGYLINLSIPRAGEVAKCASLVKTEGTALDETIGTIVTDRIADVICLLIAFGLTILLASGDIWNYLEHNIQLSDKLGLFTNRPLISLLIGFLILVGLGWAWSNRSVIVKKPIFKKIINFVGGIYKGALSVLKMEQKWLFIIYSIIIWVCYYFMTYVVFFALDSTSGLSPVVGLVVFVFGSLGIVIPSPGGMGSYHFLVQESLSLYGVNGIDAFSFANIVFFSIQLCNIVIGLLFMIILPLYNKDRLQGAAQ